MSGTPRQGLFRRHAPPEEVPVSSAVPAPAAAVPPSDPVAGETERLVEQLRDAARTAGVDRHDPMMPLLSAFAGLVRFLGGRSAAGERALDQAGQRVADALLQARTNAEAEERRFAAALAAAEAATVARVAGAIAVSADAALARRVRVFDRNTALLAAALLVATAGGCLWGGYRWGHADAAADIRHTEAGLRAAFAEGPADAATWLGLMQWNIIGRNIEACSNPRASGRQAGRRACDVPLWIEPPLASTPAPQLGPPSFIPQPGRPAR
ncbi:Hypothetical protein RMP42_05931 (plasmid) [Roseomonas mucosa]|nr:Hypothetical protein RMP42_05931 [Roseomonas mucosa]